LKKIELARGTHSDHLMFINAYDGWCKAKLIGNPKEFCKEFYLSQNILKVSFHLEGVDVESLVHMSVG
jgi:hypothetical protein